MTNDQKADSRRSFISKVAASAMIAAPIVAAAQTAKPEAPAVVKSVRKTLRIQSGFSNKALLTSFGAMWADRVNAIGGDAIRVEWLPVGTVSGPFELAKAISDGKVDGGHMTIAYHHGVSATFSLWATGPAYGMNSQTLLGWQQFGGGTALLEEAYKTYGLNVHGLLYVPIPTQPLGWFKKEINSVEDFKGLKFRTTGLALELMNELGAKAVALPGDKTAAAIKSGEVDAGDFNNTTDDHILAYDSAAKVCMVRSYAKASGTLELVFNKDVWESLDPEQVAILTAAKDAVSAEGYLKMVAQNTKDYTELRNAGVKFVRTPDTVLQVQLNAWDKIVAGHAIKDPLFARVLRSQKEYAHRVALWQSNVEVNFEMVANHYFKRQSA